MLQVKFQVMSVPLQANWPVARPTKPAVSAHRYRGVPCPALGFPMPPQAASPQLTTDCPNRDPWVRPQLPDLMPSCLCGTRGRCLPDRHFPRTTTAALDVAPITVVDCTWCRCSDRAWKSAPNWS